MNMRSLRLGDGLVACVAVAIALLHTLIPAQVDTVSVILQTVLSWCFVPVFAIWRSYPRVSSVALVALLGGWALSWLLALPLNSGFSPWLLAAPMAVFAATRFVPDRRFPRAILGACLFGSFFSPFMWVIDDELNMHYLMGLSFISQLVLHWLLLVCAYLIGSRYFTREQQTKEKVVAREQALLAVQEEERLRIAREIHDVLAHSLTLIKVQSNAGLVASRTDPNAAKDSLMAIRNSSSAALNNVRSIVHVLREPVDNQQVVRKEITRPISVGVDSVIEDFRNVGLCITERIDSKARSVLTDAPTLSQLAFSRTLIEGLTNVLRHQGKDAEVALTISLEEVEDNAQGASLDLIIDSKASGEEVPESLTRGTGTGLIGVTERLRALGGTLSAEGTAKHFQLIAKIPTA